MNRFIVPVSILFGCIILGGFYYATQTNKQASIERQQQVELQEKNKLVAEQALQEKEQKDREFAASQKEACLAIYKQESSKWNNVNGWRYSVSDDTCFIEYKDSPKKTEAQCDAQFKDKDGKVIFGMLTDWLLCKDGLFEKAY